MYQIKTVIRTSDNRRISIGGNFKLEANGPNHVITEFAIGGNGLLVLATNPNGPEGNSVTIPLNNLVTDEERFANRNTQYPVTPQTARPISTEIDALQLQIEQSFPRVVRLSPLEKRFVPTILSEFLFKFLQVWNNTKDTIYVDNREVQTGMGRRRSLGDIYMICKYYFPNVTLQQVLSLLYNEQWLEGNNFVADYCDDIQKRVWYYDEDLEEGDVSSKTRNDEYGHPWRYYQQYVTS